MLKKYFSDIFDSHKILNHISHICRMLCKVIVLYTFSFVSSLNIWRLFYQNGARIQNTYSFCRGKTTRQQMKKHPPSYWTVTGWVIRQLFADLAKYLVPGETKKYSINRHSVLVSIPKLVWTLNFDFHNFSQNLNLDCVEKKNILEFLIVKMICYRYRSRFCITPFLSLPEFRFVDSKSADILDFLQDRANFIRQEGNVFDIRMRWVLKLKT